jgi:hypothetical protein
VDAARLREVLVSFGGVAASCLIAGSSLMALAALAGRLDAADETPFLVARAMAARIIQQSGFPSRRRGDLGKGPPNTTTVVIDRPKDGLFPDPVLIEQQRGMRQGQTRARPSVESSHIGRW